ncbi:MAG: hypothetical protein GC139_09855 [Sideroxydans sp.]|nr:hypothetical protein [Sideroxydans sp.]
MEAKKAPAAHGWLWIKQSFELFRKSPLLWMVLTSIGVVGMTALSYIPIVGALLSTILMPMLLAGFMTGSRALAQGEELELAHLFVGLKQNTQELIALGGINLVAQMLSLGVMMLTGGGALVGLIMSGKQIDDPALLTQALAGAGLALLVGAILFSMLLMSMQFAPMLVIFDKMSPLQAMKTSLRAFLRNVVPLTVYGVMLLPFAILASMPMMLGWLVLLPIIIASMYVIYADLFPPPVTTIGNIGSNDIDGDEQSHF